MKLDLSVLKENFERNLNKEANGTKNGSGADKMDAIYGEDQQTRFNGIWKWLVTSELEGWEAQYNNYGSHPKTPEYAKEFEELKKFVNAKIKDLIKKSKSLYGTESQPWKDSGDNFDGQSSQRRF